MISNDAEVGRVVRVGRQVGLRSVPGVQQVGEGEGAGPGPGNRAGGDVKNRIERFQAVDIGDHGVDGGGVCGGVDLEQHYVLDDLGGNRGG